MGQVYGIDGELLILNWFRENRQRERGSFQHLWTPLCWYNDNNDLRKWAHDWTVNWYGMSSPC
jgi:hypothetical protein